MLSPRYAPSELDVLTLSPDAEPFVGRHRPRDALERNVEERRAEFRAMLQGTPARRDALRALLDALFELEAAVYSQEQACSDLHCLRRLVAARKALRDEAVHFCSVLRDAFPRSSGQCELELPLPGASGEFERFLPPPHRAVLPPPFPDGALLPRRQPNSPVPEACWEPCLTEGRCTRRGSACLASSATDCLRSAGCGFDGKCLLQGETCELGSGKVPGDLHCTVVGDDCEVWGRCRVAPDPLGRVSCIARQASDCMHAKVCTIDGKCHAEDGVCIALKDEDCRRSVGCLLRGNCTAEGGMCVARSDEDCRRSLICGRHGHCTAQSFACEANMQEDCLRSADCYARGRCDLQGHACVANKNSCPGSNACRLFGACEWEADECRPLSDAQCETSVVCQEHGQCSVAPPGSESCRGRRDCPRCVQAGFCGEECAADKSLVCAHTDACLLFGRCHTAGSLCCSAAGDCR